MRTVTSPKEVKIMLEKGDRVTIYEDPVTCEKPEGIAVLVRQLNSDDGDGLERWEVIFDDEHEAYARTINVRKCPAA